MTRRPYAVVDAIAAAREKVQASVQTTVQTVVHDAAKRWTDSGGPEAATATAMLGALAVRVTVAHARAAAAALGLRRPAGDGDR